MIKNLEIYSLSINPDLYISILAAETHVDRSIDDPESFIKSNIVGVFNLLECFKELFKKK